MESTNMIDAALNGDEESFMAAFNAALASKITDALEIKKVELASNILTPEEEANEYETEGSDTSNANADDKSTAEE